jgi:hypothetical protein
MISENFPSTKRPATIYTLHDYVYEPDILLEPSITMQFPLAAQVIRKEPQELFYPCWHAILRVGGGSRRGARREKERGSAGER